MYPAHRSNISRHPIHVYTLIQLIRPIRVGRRQHIIDPLTFSGNELFSTVHLMPIGNVKYAKTGITISPLYIYFFFTNIWAGTFDILLTTQTIYCTLRMKRLFWQRRVIICSNTFQVNMNWRNFEEVV